MASFAYGNNAKWHQLALQGMNVSIVLIINTISDRKPFRSSDDAWKSVN